MVQYLRLVSTPGPSTAVPCSFGGFGPEGRPPFSKYQNGGNSTHAQFQGSKARNGRCHRRSIRCTDGHPSHPTVWHHPVPTGGGAHRPPILFPWGNTGSGGGVLYRQPVFSLSAGYSVRYAGNAVGLPADSADAQSLVGSSPPGAMQRCYCGGRSGLV